jgi:hypothetical protein
MYYGRRVHSKELAERIASVTTEDLQGVCTKIVKNYQVVLGLRRKFMPAFGDQFLNPSLPDLYPSVDYLSIIVLFY